MRLLVHVHHDDGEFNANSLGVLAAAAGLGAETVAFIAGSGLDDAWAGGLGGHGASKVLVADDPALAGGLSQPIVDALAGPARDADGILFGAGVVSADVAAGLAARIGAGIACETTAISLDGDSLVAVRPALGDSVMGSITGRASCWRGPTRSRPGSRPAARARRLSGCR